MVSRSTTRVSNSARYGSATRCPEKQPLPAETVPTGCSIANSLRRIFLDFKYFLQVRISTYLIFPINPPILDLKFLLSLCQWELDQVSIRPKDFSNRWQYSSNRKLLDPLFRHLFHLPEPMAHTSTDPPLTGIKVIEVGSSNTLLHLNMLTRCKFAGLAPGPFCGTGCS